MAKTIDFSQALLDVFGDPMPETYAAVGVEARAFISCEKCGTATVHHEMRQRPLTLGSVCVTSLISSNDKALSNDEVVRRYGLAQRIAGPTKGAWATLEFEDATELAKLKECVTQAPQGWAISVRAAVIEALKV